MNAGIVILQDGTPCLVYDETLPHPVKCVEFCRNDFLVTLVYDAPAEVKKSATGNVVLGQSKIAQMMKTPPKQGRKLEYPLDHGFVAVLEEKKTIALGVVLQGQLADVKLVPVVFTDT
jgi:hypothetical protein